MDLFRRNQKYVFWVVAAIIIPSFVLVWGVDRMGGGNEYADLTIGTANGRVIKSGEFNAFQKRLQAALGGLPLQFTRLPTAGSRQEDLSAYLFAYSLLEDAAKAGLSASEVQVGTYLENSHPVVSAGIDRNDPQTKERAVNDFCRQMQISRADFLQGIRDWQTIGNYIDTDNRLLTVNDDSVYTFYSLNKAEVVTKRMLFMENDATRERAKAEIMARSPDELEADARNYAAANAGEVRYRLPSRWRFSWILVPFVSESSIQQPTDDEIERQYEAGRARLYENRPLDEVRDQIVAELVRQEVERQTTRNFTVDVDPQLLAQRDMAPEELVKLAQLAKYGVTVGDTGPEALPPADVVKALPEGAIAELGSALEAIDGFPTADRDIIISQLRDGYNQGRGMPPYRSDRGMYRLHLIEYQPSTPAPLDGPDGSMDPQLYETALSDMVGDRAAELAREEAALMETKILALAEARRNDEEDPDPEFAEQFDSLPTATIPYLQIADSNYAIGTLPIGDVLEPRPFVDPETGERGQELIATVDRRVPSRATFDSEPEDVKTRYRQIVLGNYRGSYGVTYTMNGPTAFINPSPSLMGGLLDRFYRGEIGVNPELNNLSNEG